jgi:resuscitation-promoting factor RpfA
VPGTPSWSKLATVGLVIFGVFLGCGGVGMGSWAVGAVGVALIAAGVGLLILPAIRRDSAYAPGNARVESITVPPVSSATHARARLHLIVFSDTIEAQSVEIRDNAVPIAKWPTKGMILPVQFVVGDSHKVQVLWERVPTLVSMAAGPGEAPTVPLDTALIEEGDEEDAGYVVDESGYTGGDGYAEETGYAEGASYDEGVESDETPEGPVYAETAEGPGYAEGDEGPAFAGVPVDEGDIPGAADDGFDGRTQTYAPAEPYVPADGSEDGSELIPAGASQGRVIELDVMDPSVMRWSTAPAAPAAPPGPVAPAPSESPRRRPSPRPRPRPAVEEESAAPSVPVEPMPEWPPWAAAAPVDDFLAPEAPEAAEPSPPAADDDGLFDQDARRPVTVPVGDPLDDPAVATAYMNATPPPDEQGRARVRNVALTVFVTDLSRSIIFYRDVLGFTEIDAGHGSTVLESGAARIVLRRVAMPPVERRVVHLLLEVPDVNAAYRDLVERGVTFVHRPRAVGQYDMMTLWAAALRDPDGHGIALTQWKPTRLG